jgi:hypothetical protein
MRFAAYLLLPALFGFVLARAVLKSTPRVVSETPRATPVAVTTPEAPPKEGTPSDQLKAAFKGDDPLGSASRIMAWLANATPEDFLALGNDIEKLPDPADGFGRSFLHAYHDAIMKRWVEFDPEGAVKAALAYRDHKFNHPNPRFNKEDQGAWLLDGIARADALALFHEVAPADAPQAAYQLGSKFRRDTAAGRAWADSLPDGPTRPRHGEDSEEPAWT